MAAVAALLGGCGSKAPTHLGTYAQAPFPFQHLRPQKQRHSLTQRIGQVAVLQGSPALISGSGQQLGLRFDEMRNDLGAISRHFATEVADRSATLVLFTHFEDQGGGGPAYFVPIFNDTPGTGLGPVDQRAAFGVQDLVGIVNMKRLSDHAPAEQLALLVHEVAHPDLAYLRAEPASGSTITPTLLGRQQAHWHASLHTEGSVLGGHGFVQVQPGRFVVSQANEALSALDLYAMGLLDASEVPDFFFIQDARTEAGFAIPAEAQLTIGTPVLGTAQPLSVTQVVQALGPRPRRDAPMNLVFALLTGPSQTTTATAVQAEAEAIDDLRLQIEADWPLWTRGRGQLCTQLEGCGIGPGIDAGHLDGGTIEPAQPGCQGTPGPVESLFLVGLIGLSRARRKRKSPGQH